MVCIYCGSATAVTNSRPTRRLPGTWRRRQCKVCVAQFSTLETPDFTKSLAVETASGKLVPFQRDILFVDLMDSLKHRPDALPAATALTDTVIASVLRKAQPEHGKLAARNIAQAAHTALKHFDRFAATSFQAFHSASLKG